MTETRIVPGAKDVEARVYYYRPAGGWGFATQDAADPFPGTKPRTNFMFRAEDVKGRIWGDRLVMRRGDVLLLDIKDQPFESGRAIETENVRMVKG